MEHDHPTFIQCAHDAFEQGVPIDRLEEECSACRDAAPAYEYGHDAAYPTALSA